MIATNENFTTILLTLYKGKYRIGEHKREKKEYRVIGEFDYLMVQSLDANLSTENQYKEMWKKTEQISKELNIGESCHNLYAIGKRDKQYETEFWCEDGYPFLFLSMIQLRMGNEIDFSVALSQIELFMTTLIEQHEYDIKVCIYYSLDSCDYILFLKAKSYDAGSKIIQGMPSIRYDEQRTLNYYCYSLCGIDIKKYLETEQQQHINKIMICFVIKDFNVFKKWLAELKMKFPDVDIDLPYQKNANRQFSYSRLGNEDVCINIMNCSLHAFLAELYEDQGLLNNSNKLFVEGLMKLRLHFDSTQYYTNIDFDIEGSKKLKTLKERFVADTSDELQDLLYPTTRKALFEVLNSCSYFEQEYFVKDIQICIQNSFDIFLSKFKEFDEWKRKADNKFSHNYTQMDFNNSVIEFINGIMSVVNGALHTDRMFFQAPGFNAVLYDIPAKLLAFYTAFVKKISDILKDDDSEKEFAYLLCPDLYLKIVLVKLFDNPFEYPVKRLLKGSIPVKTIFEPKRLMVELAHEVAHCVGDAVRMRQRRFEVMMLMFGHVLSYYLLNVAKKEDEERVRRLFANGNDVEVKNFREEIAQYIARWLHEKFDDYLKEKGRKETEFDFYQVKTKEFFRWAIILLINNPNELFGFIEQTYLTSFHKEQQDVVKQAENIYNLNFIMERNLALFRTDEGNMIKMLSGIHSLTNESYADLIMCNMLGITSDEYINFFYNVNQERVRLGNVKFLFQNACGERILSVLKVLGGNIENIKSSNNYRFNEYLSCLKGFEEADYKKKPADIFFPQNIIKDNEEYLKNCLYIIKDKKLEEKFEEIKTLYKNVTEQDMITSIENIFRIVYEMRMDVETELVVD